MKSLSSLIKASTTSMTSVPKPLKFMKPHYNTMKAIYNKIRQDDVKKVCADIISVLAMTMGDGRECLKYRLMSDLEQIRDWGHEYVRHLAGEIAQEWADFTGAGGEGENYLKDKLILLARQIVPYNMAHNAEAEACDLLMEIERLDLLEQYVDENIYQRVCLYLTRYFVKKKLCLCCQYLYLFLFSCVPYVADPENTTLLQTALLLLRKFGQYPQALRLAMQLNDRQLIEEIFTSCPDM